MTARSVQDWFQIIQRDKDDLSLARQVLTELSNRESRGEGVQQLVALFTALRLDQMTKENAS